MNQEIKKLYLDILRQEVKPALGCTEPIAVALAVAKSCELLQETTRKIVVSVSANILKNAMGVGIPGTGMVGLEIAIALSVICGKSEYGLEVLKNLCPESVDKARELVAQDMITIKLADTEEKLYIIAEAVSDNHSSKVIISERHDNISFAELDGKILIKQDTQNNQENADAGIDTRKADLTVAKIYDFIQNVDIEEISFMNEAVVLNSALAEEGLKHNFGLRVGKTINDKMHTPLIGESLINYAMAITAAASDARMAGCVLPAMSNSGSGNQGITVTMPVVATARKLNASPESLLRALTFSHLCAIHIKSYLGRLSALCGCIVASSGATCGITYLMGGGYDQACMALKNMAANITGMVCDGAKIGCALKVSTGVSCAIQSAMLAMEGISVTSVDGIIDADVEKTIANLSEIGREGMTQTDKIMLQIMINKKK